MAWIIKMPKLGQTMEEGVIREWLKSEGDEVEEDEVIAIVESEKFTEEIAAREEGILRKIVVSEDQAVPPGTPLGIVAAREEELPEIEGVEAEEREIEKPAAETGEVEKKQTEVERTQVKATPAAKRLAGEEGIELQKIGSGTGPQNAITEKDVREFVESGKATIDLRTVKEERKLSQMRKTIAERLGTSYKQALHVTLQREICVDSLQSFYKQLKEEQDTNLSLTDFILKAVVQTLDEHEKFNAIYEDGAYKLIQEKNVGLALSLRDGEGLVTPVLHSAERMNIYELSKKRREITERTLDRNFTEEDLMGGTFTITNLGPLGIDSFNPIINPPEVAILGVNRLKDKVVKADQGTYIAKPFINFSLSFDHRVVDGAEAAKFLKTLDEKLQKPLLLLEKLRKEVDIAYGGQEPKRPLREVVVSTSGGVGGGVISARRFKWKVDEPKEAGGKDEAPNPVEMFLGSLGSCLAFFVGLFAKKRNIDISLLKTSVKAAPSQGPIEELSVKLTIQSKADDKEIDKIVKAAKRSCYVENLIKDDVLAKIEWERN